MSSPYHFEPSQYELANELTSNHQAHMVATRSTDLESTLHDLQLVFLVDISRSMAERDVDPEGKSTRGMLGPFWTRYDSMIKLLKNMIGEMFNYDKDGSIPVYFFNKKVYKETFTDPNRLVATARTYRPKGTTRLGHALRRAARDNIDANSNTLFIVFTDGAPDNLAEVESFLSNKIHKADPDGQRLNVLFVRFGEDEGAIQFLQDLDDHSVFGGNVDTKSANAAFFLGPKLLILNGIYEHLENLPFYKDELDRRP
jgi:hypothetical protein